MQKVLLLSFLTMINLPALAINEMLLEIVKSQGSRVFFTCVVTPPETPPSICSKLYARYLANLSALNAPNPLVLSIDPDPYSWSPFDICRYETEHIVFGDELIVPYCPTLII